MANGVLYLKKQRLPMTVKAASDCPVAATMASLASERSMSPL